MFIILRVDLDQLNKISRDADLEARCQGAISAVKAMHLLLEAEEESRRLNTISRDVKICFFVQYVKS